ncbi:unnamed protein product, partial [marine sediment metagenome]
VENGVAYFAAGWHAKTNDGIHVYAMNPFTGKVLWEKRVDNRKPETWYDNHTNDLLISDGKSLFMCQLMFDLKSGKKSRTWFKKDKKYKHRYLLSGQGRDTSAVIPFGFLYDRKDGARLQRYHSTHWYYRGAKGLLLALTQDRVFGVTTSRKIRPNWELFARRFDDAARPRLGGEMSKDAYLWSEKAPAGTLALLPAGKILLTAGPENKAESTGGMLRSYSAKDGSKLSELRFDDAPV